MNCLSAAHQNRILGEVEDQIEQILALAFENYKSLDESLPSGIIDVFKPASGNAAPALQPAVKLYTLLHDILSPEAQNKLCRHFQVKHHPFGCVLYIGGRPDQKAGWAGSKAQKLGLKILPIPAKFRAGGPGSY